MTPLYYGEFTWWPCVTLCYPVSPSVTLCSPMFPVLPCVTLCYPVLPCVTLCYPMFPLCYPVYLLKSSCHPSHTKKSIPYTMALRQRWICSTDDFFNKRLNAVTTHLINTACKHRFIQQEINKVRLIPRSHAFETFTRQESDRVPFLVTFNPALPNINPGLEVNFLVHLQSFASKIFFH